MSSSAPSSAPGGSLPSALVAQIQSQLGFPGAVQKGGGFPLSDQPQLGFDEMTRTNKSVLKSFFAASPVHLNLDVDRDGVLKQFDQPLLPNFLRYMDGSPPGAGVWEPPTEAESIYLDVPVRMSAAQLGTGTPAAGGGAVPAVPATPGVPTPAEDDDKFLRDLKKKAFLS